MKELGGFEELIKKTITCLEELNINYCVVGAIAASYYGSIRSTEDLDIIVDLSPQEITIINNLVGCLKSQEIDILKRELVKGLQERGHITAFDEKTYFYRIDFKGVYTDLDKETMRKKRRVKLFDELEVWLTTPEIQIVAKLLPGMRTEKDILDVKNILQNYQQDLNWEYLNKIAKQYKIKKILETIMQE